MENDLSVWEDGVTYDDFKKAKDRGVHYQIVNHKLYRENDCMFMFR